MAAEGDLEVEQEVALENVREGAADENAFGLGFDEEAMQDYAENKLSSAAIANPNYEAIFEQHEDSIFCMALSPSGTMVMTGDGNDLALIWDVEEQNVITTLKGHTDSVIWVGFSCKEEYCATASMDFTVRVYNLEDYSLRHILEGPAEEIEFACWHPRGNVILAGSRDCTVWMWDAKKGRCLQVFVGHGGAVSTGGFLYDGKTAFSGCVDGSVKLWNPKDGTLKQSFGTTKKSHFHESTVTKTAFHPSKKLFATAAEDSSIFLIHGKKGKVVAHFGGHSNSVEALAFGPKHYLASGDLSGELVVWDTRTSTKRNKTKFSSGVLCIIFKSEASLFAGFVDGSVIRMSTLNGNVECIYRGHMGPVHELCFNKKTNRLLSCGDDGTCLIWDGSLNDLEREKYVEENLSTIEEGEEEEEKQMEKKEEDEPEIEEDPEEEEREEDGDVDENENVENQTAI